MRTATIMILGALALGVAGRAGAVTAAPGWAVRTIPAPGVVQGGVARIGATIFVGQGSFGAGAQSIVRFTEGGSATTVASGFNSLGGFDVDAGGTLYVVDNGGNLPGATTGDTVFAFPGAATASGLTAAGHEVVAAGTIALAQDVAVAPAGHLLVSDAVGFGGGRVVDVSGSGAVALITGFDYAGGVAVAGATVLVGDVDSTTFSGSIDRFSLAGAPLGGLASGLGGAYGVAVDGDGTVLVSGTGDVLAIPGAGGPATPRASGFAFSSDIHYDAGRDELLVLDFGVSQISAICRERDGDGVCDADDPCTLGGAATMKVAIGKLATGPGDDTLALTGSLTIPTTRALDPVARGLRVTVVDASGAIVAATVPAGAFDAVSETGWKVKGSKWTYKGDGTIAGVRKIVARLVGGVVKFAVTGKGGSYGTGLGSLPLTAAVTFDPDGQCGEAVFDSTRCTYNTKKGALRCK